MRNDNWQSPLLPERFWDKVVLGEDGCWLWQGSHTMNGYGTFWFRNRQNLAHRIAYSVLVGDIPNGLQIDHLCRVHNCVNPRHLEPVTLQENRARGNAHLVNGGKTHCPQGHPYDGDNLYLTTTKRGGPSRQCRACAKVARALWWTKHKRTVINGVVYFQALSPAPEASDEAEVE